MSCLKERNKLNGILPLYKPKGMTSHDCVMKIRKMLRIKKVGHTGTLDPEVEGVLPVCIGEATKIIPFLTHLRKEYVATVCLGTATTTEDSHGDIILEKEVKEDISTDTIDSMLLHFTGAIQQTPPMYSAVKVQGKKLYEYARENKYVERPTREVIIHEIERIQPDPPLPNNQFQIRVLCSKGTYIRTLCVDLGEELGYPAHMSYLLRTESDGIMLEETITFAEIEKAIHINQINHILQPVERCVQALDGIQVDAMQKEKVLQGQKFPLPKKRPASEPFKVMHEHQLLAMYEQHPTNENEIKPVRIFNMHKE